MTDREFYMGMVRDKGDGHTIGDLSRAIYLVDDAESARSFFRGHALWLEAKRAEEGPSDGLTSEEVARANIGYLIGYLGPEERQRKTTLWESACGVTHPIFGSQAGPQVTPDVAFAAGVAAAQTPKDPTP